MGINAPNFPSSNWDGTSPTRSSRAINTIPSFEDWDQIVAELIATQTKAADETITGDLVHEGTNAGFYNATPITVPDVTGSKGANAALTSLIAALVNLGLITDTTS